MDICSNLISHNRMHNVSTHSKTSDNAANDDDVISKLNVLRRQSLFYY